MSDKKTKVLHTLVYLNTGGTENLLKEYILRINSDSFTSSILCSREHRNTVIEDAFAKRGIKMFFAGDHLKSKKHIHGYFIYNGFKCHYLVYKYIRSIKPDVIHTHLGTNRYIIPYMLFHRKVKVFHTVHCPPEQMFEGTPTNRKENFAIKILTKFFKMRLIALHEEMADDLNKRFGVNNTMVLNNGICVEKFTDPGVTKADMRKELGIPEDKFLVGHVGRLAPEKNHEFMIKVFGELLQRRPDAHMLFVGSGYIEDEVKEMIRNSGFADKITLISNRGDVNRVLAAMDVFMFPSLFEGLGIALLEAETAGLRCVVSDQVPKEAYVSDNLASLSLDAPVSDWCDAILDESIKTPPSRCIADYDMKNIISTLENLYEDKN